MAAKAQQSGGGASSANPHNTRQYAGHLRHIEHLKAQKQDQMARRAGRIKAAAKKREK